MGRWRSVWNTDGMNRSEQFYYFHFASLIFMAFNFNGFSTSICQLILKCASSFICKPDTVRWVDGWMDGRVSE